MLEFAIEKITGNFVHVDNVPNGKKCGCICPECEDLLTAKNSSSDKVSNHFSHQYNEEGRACLMTQLHLAAQHYFLNQNVYEIPPVSFKYNGVILSEPSRKVKVLKAKLEHKIGKYLSDVMLETEVGDIYIEICVTHPSTAEKIEYYQVNKLSSVEYDLSLLRNLDVKLALKGLDENSITTNWIYEWCRNRLIDKHTKELEIARQKAALKKAKELEEEIVRAKKNAGISARKFIKDNYIVLPSIFSNFKCEIQGYTFEEVKIILPKQDCSLDRLEIFSEDNECLILKAQKSSHSQVRVIWVVYLFTNTIPEHLKQIKDAVIIRIPSSKKAGKASWDWLNYPKREQLEKTKYNAFKETCLHEYSLKSSTEQNESTILNLSKHYSNNKEAFFKRSYGTWKSYLINKELFTPSSIKDNPTLPHLMKYHRTHPHLWMFNDWHVLVYTILAEVLDSIPTNVRINFAQVFDELAKQFELHPHFLKINRTTSSEFLDYSLRNCILKEEIIETSLRIFETENVIAVNSKGMFRKSSLLKTLYPFRKARLIR